MMSVCIQFYITDAIQNYTLYSSTELYGPTIPVAYKAAYMEQFPLILVTILGTEEKCYSAQVAVATAITQIATYSK